MRHYHAMPIWNMNPMRSGYQTTLRCFSTSTIHNSAPRLTHLDGHGRAAMVDVGDKRPSKRTATAVGRIYISPTAYGLITETYPAVETASDPLESVKAKVRRKGDVLTIAQLAAIMGAKKTSDLIPLCHPLSLSNVSVTLTPEARGEKYSILCSATTSCEGKTGVEMEALTAVSVGLLTVWDMLKAVAGKEMCIGEIYVARKTGGKSGDFLREPLGSELQPPV